MNQEQTLATPISDACSADTLNTNLCGTQQDLDPINLLLSCNKNSLKVVGDNHDNGLTPGKHFQSTLLNIQNSNLSKSQQHPSLAY